MNTAIRVFIIVALALGLYACDTSHSEPGDASKGEEAKKELIINSRVSVPIPASYDKIFLDQSSIIISQSNVSIVYRWIDKKEIEFIGSEKSPYDFFKSVFSNPNSEEEKRFLEGFSGSVKHSNSSANNIEFYSFDNADGQQIYILSASVDFVVEVTTKGDTKKYLEDIVQYSNIK